MAKKKAKTKKKVSAKKAPANKAVAKGGRNSKVEPVLVFDTETGGFDPRKNSLLTVAFAAVNPKTWEIMSSIDLKIKNDTYKVTGGALKVNKIDIAKHDADKNALSPSDAVEAIIDFLKKNFKLPAKPAGQNTPFDIGFVTELFNSVGAKYNDFIHYSYLDTMPVLRLLALMGEIPDSACSLQGAKRHFGIKQKRSAAHDAMGDVEATVQVFKALIEGLSSVEGGVVDSDDEEETEEPESKKKRASKKSKKSKKDEEEEEEDEDEEDEDEEEPEDLDELEDDDDEEEEDDEDEDDEEDDDDEDGEDEEEDDEEEDDWEDD